jgi:hypothetical protein
MIRLGVAVLVVLLGVLAAGDAFGGHRQDKKRFPPARHLDSPGGGPTPACPYGPPCPTN